MNARAKEKIGALEVETPGDREVVVTRTFAAPRRLVFDAHTRPELIRRWQLGPPGWTMPICEIDFRVGGKYRYGWAHPTEGSFEMSGVYREIVAPERIVHTETYEQWESLCTLTLTEKGGRTLLRYSMVFPSREVRDTALGTGMTGGMEQSYARLDGMLAGTTA
jgi:uncharacterized protein YndB with AHSA1/START domain